MGADRAAVGRRRALAAMRAVTVCRLDDLQDGQSRGFDPWESGCDTVFLVRRGDVLRAWRDRCPHDGVSRLPWRRHAYLNAARDRIVCFAHGAQFEIDSGVCTLGPCLGRSLTPMAVAVIDGLVSIGDAA
jgi:nitrite reductase/ring-hydroxylating ferredoxin subunit